MGAFDQAARFAAQADPEAVVRRVLFPCGVELHFREWLDTRTIPLPGPRRRSGRRARWRHGGRGCPSDSGVPKPARS